MIDILPISSLHIVKFCLHINSTYKGSLKRTNKSLEWFSVWRNLALINKIWKRTGIILSLRFPTCAHVTSNRKIIKILHVLTILWILTIVWKSSVSPSWFTKVGWHVLFMDVTTIRTSERLFGFFCMNFILKFSKLETHFPPKFQSAM